MAHERQSVWFNAKRHNRDRLVLRPYDAHFRVSFFPEWAHSLR